MNSSSKTTWIYMARILLSYVTNNSAGKYNSRLKQGEQRREGRGECSDSPLHLGSLSVLWGNNPTYTYPLLDNLPSMHKHIWFIIPLEHNFTELRWAYHALAFTSRPAHTCILKGEHGGAPAMRAPQLWGNLPQEMRLSEYVISWQSWLLLNARPTLRHFKKKS